MPIRIKGVTDARIATITAPVDSVTTSLSGTVAEPGSTDGRISATAFAVSSALRGQFAAPENRDGLLDVQLEGVRATLIGNQIQTVDGRLSATLDDVSARLAQDGLPPKADREAAFAARATGPGSQYFMNCSDVYIGGSLDPTRSGIASTPDLFAEAHSTPGDDQLEYSEARSLSGDGSMRMWINASNGGGTAASFVFKCNGDRSGVISSGEEFRRQYFTFSIYLPLLTLAWRTTGDSSAKFWKAHNDQFEDGELLIDGRRSNGFIGMSCNNPTDGINVTIDQAQNGILFGDVLIYQPFGAQEAGESFDLTGIATGQEILERYGPLADRGGGADDQFAGYGGDYTYISGQERLDQRSSVIANGGFPNAFASQRGQPFVPDGWTTITGFTDADWPGGIRTMLWASEYGQPPKLIIDDVGTLQEPSSGSFMHMHQIAYQKTSQTAEPGRPELSRYYDEVGVSTFHIPHPNPGGVPYVLPNNPDGVTEPTALESAIATLAPGEDATFSDVNVIQSKANLAWNTDCLRDETRKIIHIFGKTASSNGSWTHVIYDMEARTFTNKTNNGPNSPGTWSDTGHIYGNTAIRQSDGAVMLIRGNGRNPFLYRPATDSWTAENAGRGWASSSHADGCAYNPDLYTTEGGFILCTARSIWCWRDSTETWVEEFNNVPPSGSHNEGIGIYQEASGAAFVKGSDSGCPIYRITAGPTLSTRGTPKNQIGVEAKGGGSFNQSGPHMTVLPHPDGSNRLIAVENWDMTNRWWISTDQALNFVQQPGTHPLNGPNNGNGNGEPGEGGPFCNVNGGIVCFANGITRIWRPDS